jgi:hypothetical protein
MNLDMQAMQTWYPNQSTCSWLPQDRPDLLAHMSENLSSEVATHTQARWVRAVPAFACMPPELAIEIALALGTKSFSPDEVCSPVPLVFQMESGCAG